MNGFTFRLDQILQFRKQKEDRLKLELSQKMRELQLQQDIATRLTQSHEKYRHERVLSLRNQYPDIETIKLFDAFLDHLSQEITLQHTKIITCEKAVLEVRHALLHATKEKQLLERFKQRKYTEFMSTISKAEQNELDEIGSRSAQKFH